MASPIYKRLTPTARQLKNFMPVEEEEKPWYRGDTPTMGEMMARAYSISGGDSQKAGGLFDAIETFAADPTTPIYSPYREATNPAIKNLSDLGIDVSGGVDSSWIDQHADLKGSYRLGTTLTPLAPSGSSTKENDAAYWYYKVTEAEELTARAEAEWAALQEELTYWVGRSDRNYSDQEIIDRIDWGEYPTLVKMDEGRKQGVPLSLNRAIGYSDDAIYGTLWAARNGGGTGDAMADVMSGYLGRGSAWQEDKAIAERLSPSSDKYCPYAVGSTLDEAALYFGVDSFGPGWLEENRDLLSSTDATARKMYGKVYDAEQRTLAAEAELETLQGEIERMVSYGCDPARIMSIIDWKDYPTLAKMDESLRSGEILQLTRAVPYSSGDLQSQIQAACDAKAEASKAADAWAEETVATLTPAAPTIPQEPEADEKTDSAPLSPKKAGAGLNLFSSLIAQQTSQEAPSADVAAPEGEQEAPIANATDPSPVTPVPVTAPTDGHFTRVSADDVAATLDSAQKADAALYGTPVSDTAKAEENGTDTAVQLVQQERLSAAGVEIAQHGTAAEQRVWQTTPQASRTSGRISYAMQREKNSLRNALAHTQVKLHQELLQDPVTFMRNWKVVADFNAQAATADEAAYQEALAYCTRYSLPTVLRELATESGEYVPAQSLQAMLKFVSGYGDYVAPEETPWSVFELYDMYGTPFEEVAEYARLCDKAWEQEIADIEYCLELAEKLGISDKLGDGIANTTTASDASGVQAKALKGGRVTDFLTNAIPEAEERANTPDYIAGLMARKEYLIRQRQDAYYFLLRDSEGFKAYAAAPIDKYGYLVESTGEEDQLTRATRGSWYDMGLRTTGHPDYDGRVTADNALDVDGQLHTISYGENLMYEYLKGQYGYKVASEYSEYRKTRQPLRVQGMQYDMAKAYAEAHPFEAGVQSIVAQPFGGIFGTAYVLGSTISGTPVDPYHRAFDLGEISSTERSVSRNRFVDMAGGRDSLTGQLTGVAYDVTTTLADSGFNAALFHGASPYVMGLPSFSGTYQDVLLRGGSEGQALQLASISYGAETLTEMVFQHDMMEAFQQGKIHSKADFVKHLGLSSGAEGLGEGVAQFATIAADYGIMGEKSSFNDNVKAYEQQKFSHEEAKKMAFRDALLEVGYATVLGTAVSLPGNVVSYAAGSLAGGKPNPPSLPDSMTVNRLLVLSEAERSGNSSAQIIAAAAVLGSEDAVAVEDSVPTQATPATEPSTEKQEPGRTEPHNKPTATAAHLSEGDIRQEMHLWTAEKLAEVAGGEDKSLQALQAVALACDGHSDLFATVAEQIRATLLNPDSEAHKALAEMVQEPSRITPKTLEGFATAAAGEFASIPDQQERMSRIVTERLTARRVQQKVADGAMDGLASYQAAVDKAAAEVQRVEKNLQVAREQLTATSQNMATLSEQHLNDPLNQMTRGAFQQAIKDFEGDAIVVQQAEESLEQRTRDHEAARKAYNTQAKHILATLRQEAQVEVQAEVQQVQADQAAREEAAQVQAEEQRQQDNVTAVTANILAEELRQNFPGITDAQIKQVQARYTAKSPSRPVEALRQTDDSSASGVSRDAVKLMSGLSRAFGVSFRVVDDNVQGGVRYRGAYQSDGTIKIASGATQDDVLHRTLIHELTHRAEGGKAYGDFARELLGIVYGDNQQQLEADLDAVASRYRQALGDAYTDSVAFSELVAAKAEEILGNEEVINRLAAEKPSIAGRIWQTLKDFVKKITGVKSTEADRIRRAEELYRKALDQAKHNTQQQTVATRFALLPYSDKQVQNWADSKQIEIYGGDPEQIRDFIRRSTENLTLRKKFYFGQIDSALAEEIFNNTGINTQGMNLALFSDEVVKILRDHGSEDTEKPRGQQPVTAEDFVSIPNVVGAPDEIRQSHRDRFGKPVIEFVKNSGSRQTVVTYVVNRHNDLRVQTMFVGTKKENLATPMDDQASINTPEASSGTVLSDSIPTSTENVNAETKFADPEPLLPSPEILDAFLDDFRERMANPPTEPPVNGEPQPQPPINPGVRQFAGQTAQRSNAIPDWLKQTLWGDRWYERDSNRAQAERAYEHVTSEGWEAARQRLLNEEAWNADNNVEALILLHMALRPVNQGGWGNPAAAMEIAHRFSAEGTKQGQALQARQLFQRMNPTGMRIWASGHAESELLSYLEGHRPIADRVKRLTAGVAKQIRGLDGTDPLAPDAEGNVTITPGAVSRWGVPLSQRQQALIDHYGLNSVARPGIHYNKATLAQRMLEAILMTPDPLAQTGLGMNLIERLELMRAGAPVITEADLGYIVDRMQEFTSATDEEQAGRLGDLALARAYEAYGNITPATAREKARTWRYVSMLLSLPSATRNIIGNAAQGAANAVSHDVAVLLDKLVSGVTHERTMAINTMQERADGWHAFVEETVNTYRDYFIDHAETRHGNDRYSMTQRGRVFQTRVPEAMRTLEGFLMSVGDRNVWRKAYVQSMAEQARVAEMNGVELNPETAAERAMADANYATFSEDNAVSTALGALKRVPVIGELCDFIMPFTGVPTNIVKRMGQYSPFGLAWNVGRALARAATGQTFDQHTFVNGIARGLTGSAMYAAGMLLYSLGAIRLGTGEEEDKEYALHTAMGQQYTPYIHIGDQYVSLSALAPFISPITMGATAMQLLEDAGEGELASAALSAAIAAGDQVFDASYMANLSDILGGYGSPTENLITTVGSSMISQNIPSVLSQWASALDPYVRDTRDKDKLVEIVNKGLVNKLPWLREMLPAKVDVAGRRVTNTDQGVLAFVDPFNRTIADNDPALLELDRLLDAGLDVKNYLPSDALSGTKTALTGVAAPVEGEDKETYKVRYGELWRLGGSTFDANGNSVAIMGVTDLIQTAWYQRMTDAEKAKAISGVMSAAKTGAAYEMGEKLGHAEKAASSTSSGSTKKALAAVPGQLQGRYPELDKMFEATGDGLFLPKGIDSSFTRGVQYNLSGEDYQNLWQLYIDELDARMAMIDWGLPPEEVAAAVSSAYSGADRAAKDKYVKYYVKK